MFIFPLYFILSKAKNTKTKASSLFKNEKQGKKPQQKPRHENAKMKFMLRVIYLIRIESMSFLDLARFGFHRQHPL